jgi:paraquat-inducible protein B
MTNPLEAARPSPPEEYPAAVVCARKAPGLALLRESRFWWVTLICAAVAIALTAVALGGGGLRVALSFRNGHGIKPGDALRHLGIDAGRVVAVDLSPRLDGVIVQVELDARAELLARAGSIFWIERPRVSLSRVSGLDTVVGAKYIGVRPGPEGAARQLAFEGLETPPTLEEAAPLEIAIRFREGHGLAVGDPLKHRGIAVGEVADLRLDEGLDGVWARVRLLEGGRTLACAGSLFWIERPELGIGGVRGLETLVGGRHLAVLPGPAGAAALDRFEGLDRAPPVAERAEGGLEIVLESAERNGLEAGSPVTYRGIVIGHVSSVGLSSDAASVESRAYIRPEHRDLVREDSRFSSISGIEVKLGFTGLRMDLESLATVAQGGVALATPEPPGKAVTTGHRFTLLPRPDDAWRDWKPRIAVGHRTLPAGLAPPLPARVALRWKERNLVGLTRERQRDGWAVPLEGPCLVGPLDLLSPVEGAKNGETALAVGGSEHAVVPERTKAYGKLAVFTLAPGAAAPGEAWPAARLRAPEGPEDLVLIAEPGSQGLPIAVGRLCQVADDGAAAWTLDPSLAIDPSWHGAPAFSRRDGALIGILCIDGDRRAIAPLPAGMAPSAQ